MRQKPTRTRHVTLAAAALASLALLASATPAGAAVLKYFTWTGNGANDAWNNTDNWNIPPLWPTNPDYPDDTTDNARFVENSCSVWTVQHVDEEVGQILIDGSVELTGSSVVLQCESLIFDARGAGCDLYLEITGSNGEFIAVP